MSSLFNDMSVVDDMMAEDADRMNGFVEDGTISAWGWLSHHTGGPWNRLVYFQHETMEGLFAAMDTMNEPPEDDGDDADDDDGPSWGDICWFRQARVMANGKW